MYSAVLPSNFLDNPQITLIPRLLWCAHMFLKGDLPTMLITRVLALSELLFFSLLSASFSVHIHGLVILMATEGKIRFSASQSGSMENQTGVYREKTSQAAKENAALIVNMV